MKRLLVLLPLIGAACYGQVLINELLFYTDPVSQDPVTNQQWVEIYNSGQAPVDLNGWSITGADGKNGSSARNLPQATLPAGAYLVVHFGSGQNQLDFSQGSGDFYTGDTSAYWSVDADAAALYSPTAIVDFINWKRTPATYTSGQAETDAVAAGIWTSGVVLAHDRIGLEKLEVLRFLQAGDSLGRDADSTDTNTLGDFDAGGGRSGLGPTPGQRNLTLASITAEQAAQAVAASASPKALAKRKWTILLYLNGDNNLEKSQLQKLLRIQQAGGSNADVNIVAMFDVQTIAPSTYRGQVGSTPPPAPNGKPTLRFTVPAGESPDIGEQDMGDPQVLKAFITWAKQNFPADKYGLVLASHGDGWKGFGPDQTFPTGTREKQDSLYMGELSTALTGQSFDWIAFDACLMAGIEVAHQLQPYAKYLLSSEEVTYSDDFPYESMVTDLKGNPGMDALQSITDIFNKYVARLTPVNAAKVAYTLSVVDLARVPDVSSSIRAWADLLAPGMSLFQKRDDPSDNVQILTKKQLPTVERFIDKNFIDLYHFGKLMQVSGVPQCLLTPVQSILDLIDPANKRAVILESHAAGHPNAHGLHIYFPTFRMAQSFKPLDQLYDFPTTRKFDGSTPKAHYGILQDQLPLEARDPETADVFTPLVWPLPQSPDFKFPNDTSWRKVLDRYYHPAADNHILRGVTKDGMTILPTSTGGGACVNLSDQISVPVGSTVYFTGIGSSDADQVSGDAPSYDFWDKDDRVPCAGNCIEPHKVPPGTDAATGATTNMDADQDIANTTFDQKDAQGPETSVVCSAPGTFKVTLMPWDDDHTFPFHNTVPNASYVHPQTGRHQAQVTCTPLPVTGIPSSGRANLTFTTKSDPFDSARFVALFSGAVDMVWSALTGSNAPAPRATGTQISVTGDRAQLVPASGPFDTNTRTFDIQGTATGPVAGFSNVQARYTLTFSPAYDSISGTYQVGLNNTLNNEPQPVTYTVNGTVGNLKFPADTQPTITNINTAGGGSVIAQNGWTEIHGSNLVPANTPANGVIWSSAPEFAQGKMPTQLGGVSVTVNGKPAFIYFFCSAVTNKSCTTDQINVLTPLDDTVGPVQVVVTSGSLSASFTVTKQAVVPSFFLFTPQGYVVATHSDNTFVGPETLYPSLSHPALPGETVVLYGTGFGLPSTPLVNGSSSQSGTLPTLPVCKIGSAPASLIFSGVIGPGLYQLNLTVPADAVTSEISCTYNGSSTPVGDIFYVAAQ